MGKIVIENFATQSQNTNYQTTSTILHDATTGYEWSWNGSSWDRYFGLVQGNNVTITPLVSNINKGSVASNLIVNSPYTYPVIDNIAKASSMATLPAINVVYGFMWVAPCTGMLKAFQYFACSGQDGSIELAIYDSNGSFIAKTGMVNSPTAYKGIVSLILNKDVSGNTIISPTLTGGQVYYVTARSTVLTTVAMHSVSNINFTSAPIQMGYTTTPTTPTVLSPNATNISVFPHISGVFY